MELTKEFELIYRPNRRNLMVIPAALAAILFGIYGLWALLFHGNSSLMASADRVMSGILWGIFLIGGILTIKWMADTSRQTIRITEKGIALLNDGRNSVCFYAWTSLPCVTRTRSLMAQRYMVLSPEPLKKTEAIALTNKAALTLKIRFQDKFVLWDNGTDVAKEVFAYIQAKSEKDDK